MQAAVSPPIEVPSGWRLLGQTPVCSYDPNRRERPFPFAAGDRIPPNAIHSLKPVSPNASIRCLAFAVAVKNAPVIDYSSE